MNGGDKISISRQMDENDNARMPGETFMCVYNSFGSAWHSSQGS